MPIEAKGVGHAKGKLSSTGPQGLPLTDSEQVFLAALIHKRFGVDAAAAWMRLFYIPSTQVFSQDDFLSLLPPSFREQGFEFHVDIHPTDAPAAV